MRPTAMKAPYLVADVIRAYSYLRFSNMVQERGDSRRRQTDFAARLCERHGWLLDDSLTLQDLGVSAFRGKNAKAGALGEFVDAVKTGRVRRGSVLVLENIDRLSRDKVGVALQLFIEVLNLGVVIVTAEPERTYTQGSINDIAALLEPIIYMSRAHEESRLKSTRVRAAWGQRKKRSAEQGVPLTAMTPNWVEVAGGAYRLIPARAATVRAIFAMSREGLGAQRILAALKADHAAHPPWGRSGRWNRGYVEQILRNRAAIGEYQRHYIDHETGERKPEGEPVPGFFPAAVTEEEFYAARSAIRGRLGRTGRPARGELNLFTGIVWDAVEKSPMYVRSVTPAGKRNRGSNRYSYLVSKEVCYGQSLGGGEHFGRAVEYKALEGLVFSMLRELNAADLKNGPPAGGDDPEDEIRRLTEELVAHDQKLRTYAAKAADVNTPAAALPTYLELMEEAAGQKERVGRRLETLKAEAMSGRPETLGEVHSFVNMLDELEGEEAEAVRRRLKSRLRLLVDEIWVVVEKTGYNRRVAHVKLYLRGGATRYGSVYTPKGPAQEVLSLKAVDFRNFDAQAALTRAAARRRSS